MITLKEMDSTGPTGAIRRVWTRIRKHSGLTFARERVIGLALTVPLLSPAAFAMDASPTGLWKSINDANGEPRALIRVVDRNGSLEGRIERVFPAPEEDQDPKCAKCEGENKNAPVVGLVIMTGLKKYGEEYVDGRVLDPETGIVYKSKVRLLDGGKKLSVRGYVGTPLLGRTQTWVREE